MFNSVNKRRLLKGLLFNPCPSDPWFPPCSFGLSIKYNLITQPEMEDKMTVKIDIFTKNLELTDHLNDYVVKKVEKLEKFLDEVDECRVDLSHSKTARNANDRHVAQLTLRGKGLSCVQRSAPIAFFSHRCLLG